ncbi:hypothetical protein INE90_03441 [Bacteroides uniformis]|uniref:hypothetical protein n=1 Tax=Bacteroides uniformis TaxID=820 RepID=UPI001B8B07CE|nr:hypothetical protein [Bacteroides uniformis]QUT36645.1 hypothetical protein INE90_03441 [Bacteroides uniformis]
MAEDDIKMNSFTQATDAAYIYAEASNGSQVKIKKSDLAKIIGKLLPIGNDFFYEGSIGIGQVINTGINKIGCLCYVRFGYSPAIATFDFFRNSGYILTSGYSETIKFFDKESDNSLLIYRDDNGDVLIRNSGDSTLGITIRIFSEARFY